MSNLCVHKVFAYGIKLDATIAYVCIALSTSMQVLKQFVKAILEIFESTYLRQPTK